MTVYVTSEMQRILNLPRKQPRRELKHAFGPASLVTNLHKDIGVFALNQSQRDALVQLHLCKGLLAPLPVGTGKTLIGLLAFELLRREGKCQRPLYLTKSTRVQGVYAEAQEMSRHFHMHPGLKVAGYEGTLSTAKGATLLTDYRPDVIVCDEAHLLCHATAARTKRFLRYMQDQEEAGNDIICVVMSGTITQKSIKDYFHLAACALKAGSPLPMLPDELDAWASVLDSGPDPALAPLQTFDAMQQAIQKSIPRLTPMVEATAKQMFGGSVSDLPYSFTAEQALCREAFQHWFENTPGVVVSKESSVNCALEMFLDKQYSHDTVTGVHLERLRKEPELYGLNPPTSVQSLSGYKDYVDNFIREKSRQIIQGFHYVPKWSDGKIDAEWLNARARWNAALRRELETNASEGYDSPALIVREIQRYGSKPAINTVAAYEAWKLQMHKPEPEQEAVWVSDHFRRYVGNWIQAWGKRGPLVVWCWYRELGEQLAADWGVPYYGPGTEEPSGTLAIASIKVHGTGHNLQKRYWQNLIVAPLMDGAAWEQLLGRTHRQGQPEDAVEALTIFPSASFVRKWDDALDNARYLQQTTGQKQKILFADKSWV